VIRNWSDGVPKPTNGYAVLHYQTVRPDVDQSLRLKKPTVLALPQRRVDFDYEERVNWVWPHLYPLYGVDPVVYRPASRTIKLRTVEMRQHKGQSRFYVNGVAFQEQANNQRPILYDLFTNRRKAPDAYYRQSNGYDPRLGTYPIGHYEIIDIVIQSTHYP
ncbi:hypothetical protein CU097_000652, partial [Rhizopus azygosporus]